MVVVKKQKPGEMKVKKGEGAASRIVKVEEMAGKGVKMCLYGRSKTGKTRLACSFPKPMLLIGTEDGTRSIAGIKGVEFVLIRKSDDLMELVEVVEKKYKSVALDTAGGLQDLILKEVLGLQDVPIQKSWGLAKREDWGTIGVQTKERLQQLLGLADRFGKEVVIIAHERSFGDEGQDNEVLFPTVGAALSPSTANWLNGACDYVCQTFIREEVEEKTSKMMTVKKKTGKVEYCLRVGPHPVFMTGFRMADLEKELPESLTDPSYEKIMKLIGE